VKNTKLHKNPVSQINQIAKHFTESELEMIIILHSARNNTFYHSLVHNTGRMQKSSREKICNILMTKRLKVLFVSF